MSLLEKASLAQLMTIKCRVQAQRKKIALNPCKTSQKNSPSECSREDAVEFFSLLAGRNPDSRRAFQ